MSPDRRYPLELDQTEVERCRTMAEAARQAEADQWEPAGIVAGARVADVGCGPGAMLPALAAAVGPDGRVTAGLELVEFRGRYVIRELSPRLRSPAWAVREAIVAAGMATAEDLRRWDRAFEATARRPPTVFAPMVQSADVVAGRRKASCG